MTYAIGCEVKIYRGESKYPIVINRVNEISVDSSLESLTDTAEMFLSRKLTKMNEAYSKNKMFEVGDRVIISFGYNGNNIERFRGYITAISNETLVKITMQDEMWKLKQLPVNFSHPNINLKDLLTQIAPNYKIEALEGVQMSRVRYPKTTVAEVLEKLSQAPWNFKSYFKIVNNEQVLVCGKYFSDDSEIPVVDLSMERNCVSSDLNYVRRSELKILIKGTASNNSNGTKIEFEYGDKNAVINELPYIANTKDELIILVKKDYDNYKKDGFNGSITTFGIPIVKHGMKVNLTSYLFPEKNGKFFVSGVRTTLSIGGIRQEIRLSDKMK